MKWLMAPTSTLTNVWRRRKLVRGRSFGIYLFTPHKINPTTQCQCTFVQQFDPAGTLSNSQFFQKAMASVTAKQLHLITRIRHHFNRDEEIDKIERLKLSAIMASDEQNSAEVYTDKESAMVNEVSKKMNKNAKGGISRSRDTSHS